MEIKLCNSQAEWEQALRLCSGQAKFLQSWEWGEFQEKTGKRVVRLLVAGEAVQGFEHKLPLLGRYLYLPRIKNQELRIMDELIKYCKENEYIFIRVEPLEELSRIPYPISRTKNRQPKQTLILDLTKSEEELLRQMHSKTRYNIHVAERQGVEIREERNADIFWELNSQTVARDKFKSHEKNYYEKMLSLPICRQLVAYYQGKAIASNILIVFGNTTTYLHGASAN